MLDNNQKLEWTFLEYEEKERGNDWFWALGIIIVASAVTSFIYKNYFFALFLIIGGILLAVFAVKTPDLVFYELNDKGLKIKNRLYPYDNIKAFFVRKDVDKATLFIKSERLFMPIFSMPVKLELAKDARDIMLKNEVPEEEIKEHVSEKIMDYLGF